MSVIHYRIRFTHPLRSLAADCRKQAITLKCPAQGHDECNGDFATVTIRIEADYSMEALKIAFTCVMAAVIYGIVHDQITARICLEYFTVFHPPIFHTQSPTLLGIGWGIVATWWVGAFFSVPMILAARAGRRPTLPASELLRPIAFLLGLMAAIAVLSGITGYVLARKGLLHTEWLSMVLPLQTMRYRFMADWWAHTASYGAAFVGGIVVCVVTYRRRLEPRDR
jgi:hypothetical protein